MYKKILLVAIPALFLVAFFQLGPTMLLKAANCASNCSIKEIGNMPFGTFVPLTGNPPTLNFGVDYWVKLTIKGRNSTTTPTGPVGTPTSSTSTVAGSSDIMLIIDTTTSMYDPIPVSPGSSQTVLNYEAVRDGLDKMVDLTDENKDYLGFGSFRLCTDYNSATTPVVWAYEDWNRGDGKYRGASALHIPLQSLSGRKTYFKNTIDSIKILNDSSKNNNFCRSSGMSTGTFNGGTSIGAALTLGNTQFTNILADPKAIRQDGTSYRNSKSGVQGFNNGPHTRANVAKFIVLATDGGEGVPPLIDDPEIDKSGFSPLEVAAKNGVKVYGIAFSRPGNTSYAKLQRIVDTTKGKIFSGRSRQEILDSIQAIRNDITDTTTVHVTPGPSGTPSSSATSAVVSEKINSANFKIVPPSSSTFIVKTKLGGNVNCGSTLSNCLSGKSDTSLDLKLPAIGDGDETYVYFKVSPTALTNPGQKVNVDDPSSLVTYSNGYSELLGNVQVQIVGRTPYFQTQGGGDAYSVGGIIDKLPDSTTSFSTGINPGIVGDAVNKLIFTPGNISSKNWQYHNNIDRTDFYYEAITKPITNFTTLTTNKVTDSGIYKYNGNFTVDSGTFPGNLAGKKILIMVTGNLYLKRGIKLPFDGASSVSFIVRGNIGIDPSINDDLSNEVRGIFIADGTIDTACQGTFVSGDCNPTGPTSDNETLMMEGMFVAQGGFNLDRKGDPVNLVPGEKFIYRPELMFAAGQQLGNIFTTWKEVAP